MQEILNKEKIEQIYYYQKDSETAQRVAGMCLQLGQVAMNFARVERKPRYHDSRRESDVEHSFMLALVAPELAAALELPLDLGKITQYATVHDLVELKTGDVPTFSISEEDLAKKQAAEHQALNELYTQLPAHTASLLCSYESQYDPEARFVKFIDKLLPLVVDIIGDGERIMREDYSIESTESLKNCHDQLSKRWHEKFGDEFPEIHVAHRLLAELFETKFSRTNRL